MGITVIAAAACLTVGLLASPAVAVEEVPMDWASETDLVEAGAIGRIEYMSGCAQCHGIDGRGDGIIADYLTVPPPDLTTIQQDNDGIFPAGVIYEIIEGGGGVGAHGSAQMPAWGDRFSAQAYAVLGWPHEPEERAAFVRGRILALVEHLASLQE